MTRMRVFVQALWPRLRQRRSCPKIKAHNEFAFVRRRALNRQRAIDAA